ncbi:MAG: cytochrome c family protein [Campylobacteraceae bacterium]|nr:cytochrome c family protein [Campylobacteraceae bacterium]
MTKIFFFTLLASLLSANYLTNKSCSECHENIYDEFQSSQHSKTYFNDELHRKVADLAAKEDNYDCSTCHMPSAPNQKELENGTAKPNKASQRDKDAISCFYCHQIAYVKQEHLKNKIILTRQVEGYKPTIYGSLKNPEESDKHTMTHSPIYDKYVCSGCHSHKRNSHGVLIFDAMNGKQDSTGCIKCHMPLVNGKVEKMDKKSRLKHHNHTFNGIHDINMRKKGLDISISVFKNAIHIELKNKMPHPLIIQAARVKYLKLTIKRGKKIVWKNYEKSPLEDKKATFKIDFLGKDGKPVIIPAFAYKRGFVNNIEAKKKKVLTYTISDLKKGDIITASMYVILAKPNCQKSLDLKDSGLMSPILLNSTTYTVKGKK